MSTLPSRREDLIAWMNARRELWASNAQQIGLTAQQTAEFQTVYAALVDGQDAWVSARAAAKAATETVGDAESEARGVAGGLIRVIRAFAISTSNPKVYQDAQIPAPNPGAPVPPPGQPFDFRVELNATGSITLRWKCRNPEGAGSVIYFVQRKLVSETSFRLLGGAGERAFTDETLPVGVDGATYIVTAQRGQVQGQPSRALAITFGSGGAGLAKTLTADGDVEHILVAA